MLDAGVLLIERLGNPTPPGEVGEIVVRGSIMVKEYWQNQVKIRETMKND